MTLDKRLCGILLHDLVARPHGSGDFGPAPITSRFGSPQCAKRVAALASHSDRPRQLAIRERLRFRRLAALVALEPLRNVLAASIESPRAPPTSSRGRLDFDRVVPQRMQAFAPCGRWFFARGGGRRTHDFKRFAERSAMARRLCAFYASIRTIARTASGVDPVDEALARRAPKAAGGGRRAPRSGDRVLEFVQLVFFTQWRALKRYATTRHSHHRRSPDFLCPSFRRLLGRPGLFRLASVANHWWCGCAAGLLLAHRATLGQSAVRLGENGGGRLRGGSRARHELARADLVRLDPSAVCAYWEIPGLLPGLGEGRWVPAPGVACSTRLRAALRRPAGDR